MTPERELLKKQKKKNVVETKLTRIFKTFLFFLFFFLLGSDPMITCKQKKTSLRLPISGYYYIICLRTNKSLLRV